MSQYDEPSCRSQIISIPGTPLQKVIDQDNFGGHHLAGNDSSFNASKRKMLSSLESALEKRFGDMKLDIFKDTPSGQNVIMAFC